MTSVSGYYYSQRRNNNFIFTKFVTMVSYICDGSPYITLKLFLLFVDSYKKHTEVSSTRCGNYYLLQENYRGSGNSTMVAGAVGKTIPTNERN